MNRAPLFWIALFYIAGVVSGELFTFFPLTTLITLTLLFLIEWFKSLVAIRFFHFLLLLLSFWTGFLSAEWRSFHIPSNDISRFTDRNVLYTGLIDEAPAHYPDHTVLILNSRKIRTDSGLLDVTGRIKVNVNTALPFRLNYGDEITFTAILRDPRGFRNVSGFDYALYLQRHGIRATASLNRSDALTVTGKGGGERILETVYGWRERIREAAENTFQGDSLAIFLALIIGESGYLTNAVRDSFMASGTTHILSISGSHLALVSLLTFSFLRWFLLHLPAPLLLQLSRHILPSRLALVMTFFPVMIYGLLAGNQVATNRSMLMIGTFMAGQILNRDLSLLNSLGLSALAVLLFDPLQVYDISFQLSFGSVLAIALALEKIREPESAASRSDTGKRPLRHPVLLKAIKEGKSYLWISLATTLGTAPLVAYHFNQFNWAGLIANTLIIPFAGFLVVPASLLSSFAVLLFPSDSLYGKEPIAFLLDLFYRLVRFFSRFPYAELHLASPSIGELGLFYFLVILLFYFCHSRPWKIVLAAFLIVMPFWSYWGPRIHLRSGEMRATFLDVGQGDSSLVDFPDRTTMLIDGGGRYHEFDLGRLVVAPALWNLGIRRIDYLVATHPQADHIGGLIYLIRKFEVGEVWTNGDSKDSGVAREFLQACLEKNLIPKVVHTGELIRQNGVSVSVLNPPLSGSAGYSSHSRENNDGIVLKIGYGKRSLLLTADIEKEAERKMLEENLDLKSTVIKVPHHGSRGSADSEFIRAVSPEAALISVGLHNPYHHPNPETLDLYRGVFSRVFRTDQDGSLFFRTDGDRYQLQTAADFRPERAFSETGFLLSEKRNWLRTIGFVPLF